MLLNGQYPKIMGVLNVTPDSFYDGGRFTTVDVALKRAAQMVADGVDIIDIGGESTRPQATPITPAEEMQRVLPVIRALKTHCDVPISIDTYHPDTLTAAVAAGATFINDITALKNPDMMSIAVETQLPVCLMHMQGTPKNMQKNPQYQDVVQDIADFFKARIAACLNAGIKQENICLDPGFGFGKTMTHNLNLLANVSKFMQFDCPLLIGLSRKSLFGQLLDKPVEERKVGSLTGAIIAATQTNRAIIRTHDVKEMRDAVKVIQAVHTHVSQPKTMELV